MTADGRMMTRMYTAVRLVNRQNDGTDVLHVDKLYRYAKKRTKTKENDLRKSTSHRLEKVFVGKKH